MLYRKLVSEYYDLAYPDMDEKELSFWLGNTQSVNGNVLEIGCGTGRILIPLLSRKINIVGMDSSADMLNRCREKCAGINLKAELYEQQMQKLSLPYKFEMIFIPDGTIGFVTTDDEIKKVFMNIYSHLRPGGNFMFDIQPPWGKNIEEKYGVWTGDWKTAEDNSIYCKRTLIYYRSDVHLRECMLVIEKFVDGKLVLSEENLGIIRYFNIDEITNFLCEAGFTEVEACKWLTNEPVADTPALVSIKCKKPLQNKHNK